MRAIWNNTVIAEADREDLIYIEGNWYFPRESVHNEYLDMSDHHSHCFWKGDADYYDIIAKGERNENAAWYYPKPMYGAIEKVGKDFTSYVAFWHGVTVE